MKKILLSAAAFAVVAVSAASIAPTTSEAIPAFARQTGAACLSCHFQSFPTLSPFGRAFKEGAFTDVGEQALVEDDNLSIPASLNMTLMFRPQFNITKVSGHPAANAVFNAANAAGIALGNVNALPVNGTTKSIAATADQVMMIAGRIGTNTGAFVEYDGTFANQQLLHSIDMDSFKLILSYYNAGFGEDSGLQLMSVWGQHGGMLNGKGLSINNAMGAAGNTVGVSASVANEMGAITIGGIDASANQGNSWSLAPMVRVQSFFEVGDMELGLGAIVVNGQNATAAGLKTDAKRFGIDAQLQGELGDTQFGIYADFAKAKASSAAVMNIYNGSKASSRDGYSIRGTIKPLHNIVAMIGVGQDKTGVVKTTKLAAGIEYELYQNAVINLTYSATKTGTVNTKTTGLDFEFLM